MAFGVKVKTITTRKTYTTEELFEAIKDKEFTAGKPYMASHFTTPMIVFPPLDSQNQVQIVRVGIKKETQKFTIQRAEEAGAVKSIVNDAIDKLTGGLFGIGGVLGANVKRSEELVEITTAELEAMNL